MAKGKITDAKVRALIIERKINTLDSAKTIADELGIAERTVSRIIKEELANVGEKSTTVAKLIDRNNNLQSLADNLIQELIVSKDDKITVAQLTSLRESTFKQNQLLSDKPTEIKDVSLKDIEGRPIAELLNIINSSIQK